RLDRAVGGDAARLGAADRASAADLHRTSGARLRASRSAHMRTFVALLIAVQAAGAAAFDSSRAWEHLRQLVAIGPRAAGAAALAQTRKYIEAQLAAAGIAFVEQAWEDQTPIDRVRMVNLVATIPGDRKERIVFSGHYDTKLYREFRFVGASDGGSSAAFLIELARVLKTRKSPFTIDLLFLDG